MQSGLKNIVILKVKNVRTSCAGDLGVLDIPNQICLYGLSYLSAKEERAFIMD